MYAAPDYFKTMKPYLKMIHKALLTRIEYRASFYFSLFGMFLYYVVQFSIVGVTVLAFQEINGWNINEVAFLYSFILLAQGINTMVFGPLVRFDEMIRKGEWDYLLVRPVRPLAALLSMRFDPTALAHLLLGFGFFFYAASRLGISFTLENSIWCVLIWAGGAMILASIRMIVASIAFYAVSIESLVHFFVYSAKEFILYPINIYSNPVPLVLTFLFPIAFINFYPATLFIGKEGMYADWLKYLTFPVGLGMFLLSLRIFAMGNRRYHSTGT